MSSNRRGRDPAIRYSEAFKLKVVRELENSDAPFLHGQRKYGIKGCGTVPCWVCQYGSNGSDLQTESPAFA